MGHQQLERAVNPQLKLLDKVFYSSSCLRGLVASLDRWGLILSWRTKQTKRALVNATALGEGLACSLGSCLHSAIGHRPEGSWWYKWADWINSCDDESTV